MCNFGQKLQNSPKWPHIHARLNCDASEEEITVKRAIRASFKAINLKNVLPSFLLYVSSFPLD